MPYTCRIALKMPIVSGRNKPGKIEKKGHLVLRNAIVGAVRQFFNENGFLEVETPIRLTAPAPEPHIDPVASGGSFLQASPELHMKRLLCAGYDRIFQICKCFRDKERGRLHLPEFTMLEWYVKDADYHFLMDQTAALVRHVSSAVLGGIRIPCNDHVIDLAGPWRKIRTADAFEQYAAMSMRHALENDLFEEKLAFEVEPRLEREHPVFLYDYPLEHTPLAACVPDSPDTAQRFELYLDGVEICNGYTEMTDPDIQRQRFNEVITARRRRKQPVSPLPERFLEEMGGMPDAAGCALGLDRLVMIMAGARAIDDVVPFVPEDDTPLDPPKHAIR